MGYREMCLQRRRPSIVIDSETYDVDVFGMDDGRGDDPGDALRFMFQLGQDLMIYLYVIQAGGRANPRHFFHTFWLKDCAVAHVDMEDRGPPNHVRFARTALPLNFTTVRLAGVDNGANGVFTVREQHFTAEGNEHLTMEFALDDDARLEWTRAGGWTFSASAATPPAPLEPNAWPEFAR